MNKDRVYLTVNEYLTVKYSYHGHYVFDHESLLPWGRNIRAKFIRRKDIIILEIILMSNEDKEEVIERWKGRNRGAMLKVKIGGLLECTKGASETSVQMD